MHKVNGWKEQAVRKETIWQVVITILIVAMCLTSYTMKIKDKMTKQQNDIQAEAVASDAVETPVEEVEQSDPEDEPAMFVSPYAGISLTEHEATLMARVVWAEARGESYDGQVAIAQVILNRYLKGYGNSITDICCARNQFAVGHTYTEKQLQAVWDAMSGYDALSGYSQSNQNSTEVVYFSTGCLRYGSYFCTIGGHVFRTYS